MAKAEALDALGENRAAVELIERHLEKQQMGRTIQVNLARCVKIG
jgi:hypothetical protein